MLGWALILLMLVLVAGIILYDFFRCVRVLFTTAVSNDEKWSHPSGA